MAKATRINIPVHKFITILILNWHYESQKSTGELEQALFLSKLIKQISFF